MWGAYTCDLLELHHNMWRKGRGRRAEGGRKERKGGWREGGRREEGGLAKQNSSTRMRLSCHYAVLKSLKVLMLIGVLWRKYSSTHLDQDPEIHTNPSKLSPLSKVVILDYLNRMNSITMFQWSNPLDIAFCQFYLVGCFTCALKASS